MRSALGVALPVEEERRVVDERPGEVLRADEAGVFKLLGAQFGGALQVCELRIGGQRLAEALYAFLQFLQVRVNRARGLRVGQFLRALGQLGVGGADDFLQRGGLFLGALGGRLGEQGAQLLALAEAG
jgi:hypothetical protein